MVGRINRAVEVGRDDARDRAGSRRNGRCHSFPGGSGAGSTRVVDRRSCGEVDLDENARFLKHYLSCVVTRGMYSWRECLE